MTSNQTSEGNKSMIGNQTTGLNDQAPKVRALNFEPRPVRVFGFIVTWADWNGGDSDKTIWGVGLSPNQAWADWEVSIKLDGIVIEPEPVSAGLRHFPSDKKVRQSDFTLVPATAALLADVEGLGGDAPWETIEGVACSPDQKVAFDEIGILPVPPFRRHDWVTTPISFGACLSAFSNKIGWTDNRLAAELGVPLKTLQAWKDGEPTEYEGTFRRILNLHWRENFG
jgi:hypothetical protein